MKTVFAILLSCVSAISIDVMASEYWAWKLERSAIYNSLISIKINDIQVTSHEFSCDLTDALFRQLDEPAASINTVVTHSNPNGILVVTCHVGAHSESLTVIDPFNLQTHYEVTGSYFVDWHIVAGQLVIRYDRRCDNENDKRCQSPFITVEKQWPISK